MSGTERGDSRPPGFVRLLWTFLGHLNPYFLRHPEKLTELEWHRSVRDSLTSWDLVRANEFRTFHSGWLLGCDGETVGASVRPEDQGEEGRAHLKSHPNETSALVPNLI